MHFSAKNVIHTASGLLTLLSITIMIKNCILNNNDTSSEYKSYDVWGLH